MIDARRQGNAPGRAINRPTHRSDVRRASLLLQGMALVLAALGVGGIVLAAMILQASIAVIRNSMEVVVAQNVVDETLNVIKPLPAVVLFAGAIASQRSISVSLCSLTGR